MLTPARQRLRSDCSTAPVLSTSPAASIRARRRRIRWRWSVSAGSRSSLKTYCAQAANGTGNTDTFLGERLRRLTRRLGATKAMCAVGRSILVIVWHLLADPAARFTDLGPGWHDQQAGRDRKIRGHLRQLKALGLDVTVNPAAA